MAFTSVSASTMMIMCRFTSPPPHYLSPKGLFLFFFILQSNGWVQSWELVFSPVILSEIVEAVCWFLGLRIILSSAATQRRQANRLLWSYCLVALVRKLARIVLFGLTVKYKQNETLDDGTNKMSSFLIFSPIWVEMFCQVVILFLPKPSSTVILNVFFLRH